METKIDFVVTWVNGDELKWRESKEQYAKEYNIILNSDARYRDWNIFQFWFRTVEKYAPWVNKIYLITEGHLPSWINLAHPNLVHVKHSDYIESKYLPTFNSNVIELNIPNIRDLSEHFVLFNDDTILNDFVSPTDFFSKDGIPLDVGIFSPIVPHFGGISSIVLNNLEIINKYFSSREVIKNNFGKFYTRGYGKHLIKNFCVLPWKPILGFYDIHIPISYKKSNFEKVYNLEKNSFEKTSFSKFRNKENINHWLIRYFQLCKGDFIPRKVNFGQYYNILDEIDNVIEDINSSKHKVICLNDGDSQNNFEACKEKLILSFTKKFPVKSRFEL